MSIRLGVASGVSFSPRYRRLFLARRRLFVAYPLPSAFPAKTDHGGVREVCAESVLTLKSPRQRLEHAHRDLLLRSAFSADEVAVRAGVGAAPARDAIVQMGVGDVSEPLERFEVAIDGRGIDLRIARADRSGDLQIGRASCRERVGCDVGV